jgi:hypothetical protein
MGTLYRATCGSCAFKKDLGTGAWDAVRLDSGKIEVLPHPLEAYHLKRLGFTWEQARREKRLVGFERLMRAECGETLDYGRGRAGPVSHAISDFWALGPYQYRWPVSSVAKMARFLIVRLPERLRTRLFQGKPIKGMPSDATRCAHCGGELRSPGQLRGRKCRCPQCGEHEFSVEICGIS